MAKPITNIQFPVLTEEEKNKQELEKLLQDIASNAGGVKEAVHLLQELHNIGVLAAANSALLAKKQIADILLDQVKKPAVTNLINHAMGAVDALGQIDPASTQKVMLGLHKGMEKAADALEREEKTGVVDLYKAMRDPDINRALTFGLNLLKGFGEGLNG